MSVRLDKVRLMEKLHLKNGKFYINTYAGLIHVSRVFRSLDAEQNIFDANCYIERKNCTEGVIHSAEMHTTIMIAPLEKAR